MNELILKALKAFKESYAEAVEYEYYLSQRKGNGPRHHQKAGEFWAMVNSAEYDLLKRIQDHFEMAYSGDKPNLVGLAEAMVNNTAKYYRGELKHEAWAGKILTDLQEISLFIKPTVEPETPKKKGVVRKRISNSK